MIAEQAKTEARRVRLVTGLPEEYIVCYEPGHYGVLVEWPSGVLSLLKDVEAVQACLRRIG